MSETIFTAWIPDDVGFTDQLMQLALLYRVGTAAGMAFRMTPLASSRTPPGFWQRFDPGRILPTASPADLALPRRPHRPLARAVAGRGRVRRSGAGGPGAHAQLPPPGTLGELRLQGESRGLLTRITGADAVRFEGGLGQQLRALFAPPPAAARRRPSPELRLLAHLRCGDAADIALFPQTGYLAWHRVIARTGEVRGGRVPRPAHPDRGPARAHRAAPPALRGLQRRLRPHPGVDRRGGRQGRRPHPCRSRPVTPRRRRPPAHRRGPHAGQSTAVIGEDLGSLCALLWEAQEADLIVVTGNQRMLAKFLALLGPREHSPAMLLLEADGDQARSSAPPA